MGNKKLPLIQIVILIARKHFINKGSCETVFQHLVFEEEAIQKLFGLCLIIVNFDQRMVAAHRIPWLKYCFSPCCPFLHLFASFALFRCKIEEEREKTLCTQTVVHTLLLVYHPVKFTKKGFQTFPGVHYYCLFVNNPLIQK